MAVDPSQYALHLEEKPQFEKRGTGLLVRAPAKINLTLLIAGKRPDGFHDIETLMVKITYYDEILIEPGQGKGIELIRSGSHWAPDGPDNLVYQAAEHLLTHSGRGTPLKITLNKQIPAGTGLGSASSDAAATLLGLNRLLKLNCSDQQLHQHALRLGCDVPFFLGGPLAYCTGRGEKIKFLPQKLNFQVVLCIPNVTISTEKVYKNYQHDPSLFQSLHDQIHGYIGKNRIDLATKMCANMLANSCFNLCEGLDEVKKRIESQGLKPLCLSGSGSALYYYSGNGNITPTINDIEAAEGRLLCNYIIAAKNPW